MTAHEIADSLRRCVHGPMWHGPALGELLAGVSAEEAMQRPVANAHTIAELALHITAWADIARERIRAREPREATTEEDWPDSAHVTAGTWPHVVARLRESYERLAAEVEALTEEELCAIVPGRRHDVAWMLRGVVEHGTYHGGQVAVVRKALRELV